MKICIVGLGAVGGLTAAWLARSPAAPGLELSALARGRTLAAVQAHGLGLDDAGRIRHLPLRAVSSEQDAGAITRALGAQDLVVLAVKGPALAAVAPAVRALCGPQTQVLVAMNGLPWWFFDGMPGPCAGLQLHGVDPGGLVRRLIPSAQVLGCVVHLSASAPAPGVVRHVNGNGLVIGSPAGGPDPRLAPLAALLEQAGFAVTQSERIQRDIWFKLWGNMTMNPVSALTGAPCDRVLDDDLVRGLITEVMREAQAVGAALGLPLEQTPEQRHQVTRRLGAFKTSMLQDLEAGRPLELDALLGAVLEVARHLQLAMPFGSALFGLARLMAQQRGLYPSPGR